MVRSAHKISFVYFCFIFLFDLKGEKISLSTSNENNNGQKSLTKTVWKVLLGYFIPQIHNVYFSVVIALISDVIIFALSHFHFFFLLAYLPLVCTLSLTENWKDILILVVCHCIQQCSSILFRGFCTRNRCWGW